MHITQGTFFSFLPELTDTEITAQIQSALDNNWPCSVEFTDDPHPRNVYWGMWGLPMFDLADVAGVLAEVNACPKPSPSTTSGSTPTTRATASRLWRCPTSCSDLLASPASGCHNTSPFLNDDYIVAPKDLIDRLIIYRQAR